ncbi:ubiquinol-cytochrome C chaperone [Roseomonas terrae]|jgi:cytochrome b pre-mRNA-processing protein 3|uniref:Ubiquinol-cytochrome C chaperone n=1 Tax=Neoroseomonas terrae TaxID=424799 RepID=A0ABS5EFX0_9PROT|nr:ubiquinol-cytochrome C chaperone family protein [Neoroseomonas terrae]MBR0649919.1 ubiquinol-cytochrome C chaperone [Neoroseomonas terrae]
MGILAMFRRRPHERAGFELYGAAVAAARSPALFAELGVPDTAEGRFDLVTVHVGLVIRRLRADGDARGAALAQAVFDAMFADMDQNLREMGVSDLAVGKRVRWLWEGFHGRALAYEQALDSEDPAVLPEALARNVWRGEPPPGDAAARLAGVARAQAEHLGGQGIDSLVTGHVAFLSAEDLLRDA